MKLLVVEDDLTLSTAICFELDCNDYLTVAAYNCKKAYYLIQNEHFDLAILDVNLPDGNGFDLCRTIKKLCPQIPVIFLSANDLEQDILDGFDLGAEDYVTKPFNMKILLRRIEVAVRRNHLLERQAMNCWSDGFLSLDFSKLTAVRGNEKIAVTSNEYKLLIVLIKNAGNILTRQMLLEQLWDIESNFIDDHALTVTINRLRAKIEDDAHTYIKTVRGIGYVWTGEAV